MNGFDTKFTVLPVIFGGLVFGLLLGGGMYYFQIQNTYSDEASKVIKSYEAKLETEQRIKETLLERTNELEEEVVELESKVLDLDKEGISRLCIGSRRTPYVALDDLRASIGKMNVSDNIIRAFFANGTIKDLVALNSTTDYTICQFDDNEITFVLYGQYAGSNNFIGFFKEAPNSDNYMLSYNYEFNAPSGDIGMCEIQGVIEGFQTDHLLFSCGGGDGPDARQNVYSFNTSTGEKKLIKECRLAFDELTCDINLLNP